MGAGPSSRKGQVMAKIGSFKKSDGTYEGRIVTLSVQAEAVRIVPEDRPTGNAPSHRVIIGDAEVGAGWEKQSQDKRPYLSIKLDDPSFTAPIFAQLFEGENGEHDLVWTRQSRRD